MTDKVIALLGVAVIGLAICIWLAQREPRILQPSQPVVACTQAQAAAPDDAWLTSPESVGSRRAKASLASSDGLFGEVDLSDPEVYQDCPCARQHLVRGDWRYRYLECRCSRDFMRKAVERTIAARGAEPKQAWACGMEQALLSRLTAQSQASSFTVTSIDCRSADCRILARGSSRAGAEVFRNTIDNIVADEALDLSTGVHAGMTASRDTVRLYALVHRRSLREKQGSRAQ